MNECPHKSTTRLKLTSSQRVAFEKLGAFLQDDETKVFILTGYAGTGKTTLMKMFAVMSEEYGWHPIFLASTGRAAKILKDSTGKPASTVHSLIYRFSGLDKDIDKILENDEKFEGQLALQFSICDNMPENNTVYVIDEASMISDRSYGTPKQAMFGSGKLLSDMFRYDPNGKFLFVGDLFQLPPVCDTFSPALSVKYINEHFNFKARETNLTDVVRQKNDNDLIMAANRVKEMSKTIQTYQYDWIKFPLSGYEHICTYDNFEEMCDRYIRNIRTKGYKSCTMISRSNHKCKTLSGMIRRHLGLNGILCKDDLLLIIQNNVCGLVNGDFVNVKQIGNKISKANLTFINVEVENLADNHIYSILLIEELLYSPGLNISDEQQRNLLIDFHVRMKRSGIRQDSDAYNNAMREDPYLNALRATYGYVITCHKAQGGEWNDVYLDLNRKISYRTDLQTLKWLYTAMTRAKNNLHLVKDFYIQ